MAAQGWLKGTIVEVVSGDTVAIAGGAPPGVPPPTKRVTLAGVTVPKLGRRDGSAPDEPWAWEAREFLRKAAIGRPCVFRVEYAAGEGGREFGTVAVDGRTNLAVALAAAGWARPREDKGGKDAAQSPAAAEVAAAAAAAEARGLGAHARGAAPAARPPAAAFDAAAALAAAGRGRPVPAVVESVINGSMLRVTLLPGLQSAPVMVAGVVCPSTARRAAPGEGAGGGGEGAAAAAASAAPAPEPLAPEARCFTEARVLGRDVRLVLEGVSQHGVLVASVRYDAPLRAAGAPAAAGAAAAPAAAAAAAPEGGAAAAPEGGAAAAPAAPAAAAAAEGDLGFELARAGLARVADWSAQLMASGSFRLREAERAAKAARAGLWRSYVPPASATARASDRFSGAVAEVPSGDCLVVRDAASGAERRVHLSSVRAPRLGGRDRPAEPWAAEAREFLRARLIGKDVDVAVEYTRRVAPPGPGAPPAPAGAGAGAAGGGDDRTLTFAAVTVCEKAAGGEAKANNVAELLLVRGLASVVRHRAEEERAAAYEDLVAAEDAGRRGKKGVHGAKAPPAPRVNDLAAPGAAARARAHLPFLQRAGRLPAVVEWVASGSRVRLSIPRESVVVAFSPSAVRAPQRARAGAPAADGEPLWAEAAAFTRSRLLQRDVEVEVESVDKAGTFLGTLRLPGAGGRPGADWGAALLEAGLATLHPAVDPARVPDLAAAQAAARAARRGVWEHAPPAEDGGDDGAGEGGAAASAAAGGGGAPAAGGAPPAGGREPMSVVVTDVADGNAFFVQDAAEPRVAWLAAQLEAAALGDAPPPRAAPLKPGDGCLARFDADGRWYRARVEAAHASDPVAPEYDVQYVDFGNRSRVGPRDVRPQSAELAAVPPQARAARLAYVRAPPLDADLGADAAALLAELVGGGRRLAAVVERRERAAPPEKKKGWGAPAAPAAPPPAATLHLTLLLHGEDGAGAGGDAEAAASAADDSVNARLLAAGLARLDEPRGGAPPGSAAAAVLDALRAHEAAARRAHLGMWEHGDPGDDDDDGGFPAIGGGPGAAAGRRAARR